MAWQLTEHDGIAPKLVERGAFDVHNAKQGTFSPIGKPNIKGEVRMIEATDTRHLGNTVVGFMDGHGAIVALKWQKLPWRLFNPRDPNNRDPKS